jgi:DNA-binding phage protein
VVRSSPRTELGEFFSTKLQSPGIVRDFFVRILPRYSRRMIETQKLNAALRTSDRETICDAIRAMILAADNVRAFAREAGVDRTMLYRAFKHNPGLGLVLRVLSAANLKLVVIDHPNIRAKPSSISEHFNSAFDSEEITLITKAFSKTLHDQENVALFAKKINAHRVTLYRSFTAPRVPRLGTILKFLNALGLRLAVKTSHRCLC